MEPVGEIILRQVCIRACRYRADAMLLAVLQRHHHDLGCGLPPLDQGSHRQAVHAGHADVDEHEVGLLSAGARQRLASGIRARQHFEVAVASEKLSDRACELQAVVDDHDSDALQRAPLPNASRRRAAPARVAHRLRVISDTLERHGGPANRAGPEQGRLNTLRASRGYGETLDFKAYYFAVVTRPLRIAYFTRPAMSRICNRSISWARWVSTVFTESSRR